MIRREPKVLLYDIETTPNLAWVFEHYEANVLGYEKQWELLSFAYKWLNYPKIKVLSQRTHTEKELVLKLHELFDEADFLVAHNGDEFDFKKTNAKFIEYGLRPPSPAVKIDTKKLAKRYFKFNTNKLDDLCEKLKIGRKLTHQGIELWLGCIRGEKKCFLKMEEYNRQDVRILEKLYLKLRPWILKQPGISLAENQKQCPACSSYKIIKRGICYGAGWRKQKYSCLDCGAWTLGVLDYSDR